MKCDFKVCQKLQTAEKRGNVSFQVSTKSLIKKYGRKMMKKKGVWGGPIFQFYIKYLFVFFINYYIFFFSFLFFWSFFSLDIFCGWMPEFEDKAIKLPRNTGPTTITPTLMLTIVIYTFIYVNIYLSNIIYPHQKLLFVK